jgi:hypothetical protein
VVVVDTNNQPVVAYRTSSGVTVQHYDGSAWKGLTNADADSFADAGASGGGGFTMAIDPTNQIYLAQTGSIDNTMRRFNSAPNAGWEPVGPDDGLLPHVFGSSNSIGARLVFTAPGRPVLGVFQSSAGQVVSLSVFHFDGSNWATSGTYANGNGDYAFPLHDAVSLAPTGSDVAVSWMYQSGGYIYSPLVQRNTPSGWSPVGPARGEIAQFARRGFNINQVSAATPLLLQTGSDLYLATIVMQGPNNGFARFKIVLSRKAAN